MNRFFLALQFLTLFRVKKNIAFDESELGRSMQYFPVIGALQGLLLLIVWYVLSTLLPDSLVTAILLLILVLTNGGLHLTALQIPLTGSRAARRQRTGSA